MVRCVVGLSRGTQTRLLDPREARRRDNIRTLLHTLNDIYELPAPRSARELLSGPAPSKRVPCTFCHRSGKAYSPALRRVTPCPVCNGAKWRPRRPGEPAWDEMTGQLVSTAETRKPEPMSPQRLENEIARLETSLRLSAGEIDPTEKEAWERARENRDKDASYAELERVLGVMQIELPLARSAVTSAYLSGLGCGLPRHLDEAMIAWISARMRGPVRIPKRLYAAQQEALREECRKLLKAGTSEDSVMKELGVGRRLIRDELAAMLRVSGGPPASVDTARTTPAELSPQSVYAE